MFTSRNKNAVCHSKRLRAGNANHRQTRFPDGGGDRSDGIVEN
jgi:hypothetical protein